ncbi:MAG: hypothetical protein KKG60_00605, partial [Nanoarchaeota archaeon]|nr:hypothetical protein [Nanoarchaeota archaeon]
ELGKVLGIPVISGFGTLGEVNVTISSQISLNLTYPDINFGTGYVTAGSHDYACLNSEDGTATGWSAGSVEAAGIVVENIGNTDINVTFNMAQNVTSWVGGTNPRFEFKSSDNESNSCNNEVTAWTAVDQTTTGNITTNNLNASICGNLTARSPADSINFNVNLTIPSDAYGTKGVLFTFEASMTP